MMAVQTNPLVDDYLRRLDAAAAGLPPEQRSELVAEIREHLDHAVREAGGPDDVAVRNALERMGSPEEIVAAAHPDADAVGAQRGRLGGLEIAALIALLFPVVGWLIGAILVVNSRAWNGRDKRIGLLLPLALLVLGFLLALMGGPSSSLGPLEAAFFPLFFFFGGPLAALYLASRLRQPTRA